MFGVMRLTNKREWLMRLLSGKRFSQTVIPFDVIQSDGCILEGMYIWPVEPSIIRQTMKTKDQGGHNSISVFGP